MTSKLTAVKNAATTQPIINRIRRVATFFTAVSFEMRFIYMSIIINDALQQGYFTPLVLGHEGGCVVGVVINHEAVGGADT